MQHENHPDITSNIREKKNSKQKQFCGLQIETKFLSDNQYGVVAIADKKYWHAVNQTMRQNTVNHVTMGLLKEIEYKIS